MNSPPGGLVDGQRRPRVLRLAKAVDWYIVDIGRFELVGTGDVSMRDVKAVRADMKEAGSPLAVFVCVARPREIEEVIGKKSLLNTWSLKRITWSENQGKPIAPKLASVARGARLALLPDQGLVWVDGEHLFKPGETVPLPWTDPPVELLVVRPRTVLAALRTAIGPKGPERAELWPG
ncbi:MAG: hypothetical protein ACLPQS_08420 [Acidimicrobiales bacterium]